MGFLILTDFDVNNKLHQRLPYEWLPTNQYSIRHTDLGQTLTMFRGNYPIKMTAIINSPHLKFEQIFCSEVNG